MLYTDYSVIADTSLACIYMYYLYLHSVTFRLFHAN